MAPEPTTGWCGLPGMRGRSEAIGGSFHAEAVEIAALLHFSAKTVFNTLSGVRQKLGARTTAERVHRAADMGLLTGTRTSELRPLS